MTDRRVVGLHSTVSLLGVTAGRVGDDLAVAVAAPLTASSAPRLVPLGEGLPRNQKDRELGGRGEELELAVALLPRFDLAAVKNGGRLEASAIR